jgi:hypothetical protein
MLGNRARIILIIFTLLFLWIYYETPFWLSNIIIGLITSDIERTYRRRDGKLIKFKTNHYYNDVDRANELVKKNNSGIVVDIPYIANIKIPHYAMLDSDRIENYTITESTIARSCRKIFDHQKDKMSMIVGFSVNTRKFLPKDIKWSKGNFIRLMTCTYYRDDTVKIMCEKYKEALNNLKDNVERTERYNISFSEAVDFLMNVNYYFNITRGDVIRENGEKIQSISSKGYPPNEKIKRLYDKSNRAALFISAYDNKRVLTTLVLDFSLASLLWRMLLK